MEAAIDSLRNDSGLNVGTAAGALRVVIYVLCAIGLMLADQHGGYIHRLKSQLSIVVYPLIYTVELPARAGEWLSRTWLKHSSTMSENRKLEQALFESRSRMARLESVERENERLRALLGAEPRMPDRTLLADILDFDLDPYSHRIAISRGQRDGLYEGQPLMDANGIVGQVFEVTPILSSALMISDPSHAVPVTINRTGLRGIAYGIGRTDQIELRDIPISADVVAGDLLVTSGLGDRFPTGIPVGSVLTVSREDDDAFLTITARPAADLGRIHQVLVIWPEQHRQSDAPLLTPPAPGETEVVDGA